ncbi:MULTISPECIES: hypothetical protein [unclassified Symbiopectobacterium]|uniref:hypothetical protein n=2 Tax=Symbiopectobacterium TaxID=801 RepID=UPI0022267EEE|nr:MULTISPECIES: hypothetical protein [unclassified Symbiopectobacterium]MCW2474512.1 hypothetical protein [Candidatus Symbiopectobacterium sp. NZEC151]MCW2484270.1 hypothetical protein [Candidatus Symbiopectobacterium sp. NZEC127]
MQQHDPYAKAGSKMCDWVTVNEAVHIMKKQASLDLSDSDIYRYALCNKLHLSIYFQSPIKLRRVRLSQGKIHLIKIDDSLVNRLCFLDTHSFSNGNNLIPSATGEYISPHSQIIDTALIGHEFFETQRLLATTLHLRRPLQQDCDVNYGISVIHAGELFQAFEINSLSERIKQQIIRLPKALAEEVNQHIPSCCLKDHCKKRYFPIHHIPQDACFVLRQTELDKLRRILLKKDSTPPSSTRISSPLSRLFWLSCKHNQIITPLINQPYKLVSIFEQWAQADGISDRLSGDTLKAALERGKPHILKG